MIRPVGEIFEDNGVKLQVVKKSGCSECYYDCDRLLCNNSFATTGLCICPDEKISISSNSNSRIFKKVEP